jgi:HK97 family phage major capsid protein
MPARHRASPGPSEPSGPDPVLDDLRGRQPQELQAIIADLDVRIGELHVGDDGELRDLDGDEQARFDRLIRIRDRAAERLREHDRIAGIYRDHPGAVHTVYGNLGGPADPGGWVSAPGADPQLAQFRHAAMTTLDRYRASDVLSAAAADRADAVLRTGDPQGLTARYVGAVGSEHYAAAFGKMLADPATGHLRFSLDEAEAVRAATMAAEAAEYRAGPLITGSTGFPLPLTVDPSIIMTGAGALNPVRALATVTAIGTHDWVGVASAGVTASYDQEGTEVSDDTPDLVGPKISTQRGTAFVPVSAEAIQDWPSVQAEMARLIADARDVLDATAFLTGNGTNQPFGIFGGDATYSLGTTQRVLTATTAVLAVGDSWSLKAQIPARFLGRTTFVAHPTIFDTIYRFVGGNSAEPFQFSGGDRAGDFLGRPKAELSTLVATTTTGSKVVVGGDWATAYRIVDRLGMSVEIVQHLVGANHRPTGQRGVYVWWRTGAAVTAANALRYLEAK